MSFDFLNKKKLQNKQTNFDCPFFSIKILRKQEVYFVVSKKIHKQAVKRNLIKRRLRNAWGKIKKQQNQEINFGIKVFTKQAILKAKFSEIVSCLSVFVSQHIKRLK